MAPENQRDMIIVWDFDRTILEEFCDHWVVQDTGLTKLYRHLLLTLPRTALMDRMLEELHSQGKTIDDLVNHLSTFKVHPQMISAIRSAHNLGCDMKLLSDANQFFIETILKNHGIHDCFSEIITNPTVVDEQGKLRISPYHGLDVPPHDCMFCPPNMCKGMVIEKIQDPKQGMIYIAVGRDDLCPTLKLREGDHVLPKTNLSLYHLVTKAKVPITPKIHEWKDGEELEKVLIQLISPQAHV